MLRLFGSGFAELNELLDNNQDTYTKKQKQQQRIVVARLLLMIVQFLITQGSSYLNTVDGQNPALPIIRNIP